jgi:hypothetical protein
VLTTAVRRWWIEELGWQRDPAGQRGFLALPDLMDAVVIVDPGTGLVSRRLRSHDHRHDECHRHKRES